MSNIRGYGPSISQIIDYLTVGNYLTQYALVSGERAFTNPVGGATPTSSAHLATRGYVDDLFLGHKWQDPVLSRFDPTATLPVAPVVGDRYLATATANTWTINRIYQCVTAGTWVGQIETTPTEGYALEVVDENLVYWFNGTSWTNLGTSISHSSLVGLTSGDDHTQYLLATGARALSGALNEAKGIDIASATTTDIGAATGNYVEVTGAVTITGLGTVQAGTRRLVRFTSNPAPLLAYNGTSLILPGSRDIQAEQGDRAEFISLGSGNWICMSYLKAVGIALGDTNEQIIASTANMSSSQARGAQINNYGQANDTIVTLPACLKGMNFSLILGTTVAKYYRIDPNASEVIYLDGTALTGGKYVGIASAVAGAAIQFRAFQTGAAAWSWYASTISGIWVSE